MKYGVLLVLLWPITVFSLEPECPQPRFTDMAPQEYLALENPLRPDRPTLRAARRLYLGKADRGPGCAVCHGDQGDGQGPLAASFDPAPRNFTCSRSIRGISDGQLFWIIRYGSPGTGMPAHSTLEDAEIWQLVLELRRLAG